MEDPPDLGKHCHGIVITYIHVCTCGESTCLWKVFFSSISRICVMEKNVITNY